MKNKIFSILVVILVFCVCPLTAESGWDYDWRTGNSHHWQSDGRGNTYLRGYNYSTGKSWRTDYQANGDMSGYNSNYEFWKYDSNTKRYYNYMTGETRYYNNGFGN